MRAAVQTTMPICARRKWSPTSRASPTPAIGAAKNSPNAACVASEISVFRRDWAAAAARQRDVLVRLGPGLEGVTHRTQYRQGHDEPAPLPALGENRQRL